MVPCLESLENRVLLSAAPSNLTATLISESQINLHWVDNSNNEQYFQVMQYTRDFGTLQVARVGANVTSVTTSDYSGGRFDFSYRLHFIIFAHTCYHHSCNDVYSNIAMVNMPVPDQPGGLTVTASAVPGDGVLLEWTSVLYEAGYRIFRSPSGEDDWTEVTTVGPFSTSELDYPIPADGYYTYRIVAFNYEGESTPAESGSVLALTAGGDYDDDDLDNLDEYNAGTDIFSIDTDGDLLTDGWEVDNDFDPLDSDENGNSVQDGEDDGDTDGLDNVEELIVGTLPGNDDSDGDGTEDGPETGQGSDPNDPSDGGQPPTPDPGDKTLVIETLTDASLDVGKFTITQLTGDGGSRSRYTLTKQQEVETFEFYLRPGETYELSYDPIRAYDPPDASVSLRGYLKPPPGVLIDGNSGDLFVGFHNTPRTWQITVPFQIDIAKVDRNNPSGVLDEETEDGQGGYLPVNWDDDNWDGEEDYTTNKIEDGENDLLPLVIRLSEDNPPAKVKITVPAISEVRLFKTGNVGETGEVSIEFDPADLGLERVNDDPELGTGIVIYAGGREAGPTMVTLEYDMDGDGTWEQADTVKLNVFDWSGPIAVPGYTKYTYTATGGLDGATSQWIDAEEGQVTNTGQENDSDTGKIFWNVAGPVIGGAIYRAASGFDWLLDVNIVQIKIENLSFTINSGVHEGVLCGTSNYVLSSGNQQPPQPAMEAQAKITITGPTINGVQRGVEYMDVGFIQLSTNRVLNVPALSGNLNDVLNHYVEGGTVLLDSITRTCQGSVNVESPWYDAFNENTDGESTGYFSGDTNTEYNQTVMRNLRIEDTPAVPLPLTFWSNNRLWTPTGMNVDWAFSTFIGVRTRDPGVDSSEEDMWTQRARGKWSFNGTGTIQYAPNGDPTWTAAAGAGVTLDQQITEVTDGSPVPDWVIPPLPGARVLNDVLFGWTVVNGIGRRVPHPQHD